MVISRFQTRAQFIGCSPAAPASTTMPVGRTRRRARSMVWGEPTQSITRSTPCSRIGSFGCPGVTVWCSSRPPSCWASASMAPAPAGRVRSAPTFIAHSEPKAPGLTTEMLSVRMQSAQGGGGEQPDGPGADDDGPLPLPVPVQGRVQGHGCRFGERGPRRGEVADREQLRLVGDHLLGPSAAGPAGEAQRGRGAARDPGEVEPLADVRLARGAAAAHGVEATLRAADDDVDGDPIALLDPGHPGADLVDDGDELVAGDLLGVRVVGAEHGGELGVGQADVRAADQRQLRAQQDPAGCVGQRGRGLVLQQPEQAAGAPPGALSPAPGQLLGCGGVQVSGDGDVSEDRAHG